MKVIALCSSIVLRFYKGRLQRCCLLGRSGILEEGSYLLEAGDRGNYFVLFMNWLLRLRRLGIYYLLNIKPVNSQIQRMPYLLRRVRSPASWFRLEPCLALRLKLWYLLVLQILQDYCFFVKVNQIVALHFLRLSPTTQLDWNTVAIQLLNCLLLDGTCWVLFRSIRSYFEFSLRKNILVTLFLEALVLHLGIS
jgi:hypothetical protein